MAWSRCAFVHQLTFNPKRCTFKLRIITQPCIANKFRALWHVKYANSCRAVQASGKYSVVWYDIRAPRLFAGLDSMLCHPILFAAGGTLKLMFSIKSDRH